MPRDLQNSHLNFKRHAERLGALAECLDSVCEDRVGLRLACDPFGLHSSASSSRDCAYWWPNVLAAFWSFNFHSAVHASQSASVGSVNCHNPVDPAWRQTGFFFCRSECVSFFFFTPFESFQRLKGFFFSSCFIYREDKVSPVILNLSNATATTLTLAILSF